MKKNITSMLLLTMLCSFSFAQQDRFRQASRNLVDPTMTYDAGGDLVIAATSEDDPNCGTSCTATGQSSIVVTKRNTAGGLIWNKEFNFSAVDRAMHIENDGQGVVVLGTIHKSITSTIRSYEYNPVVFVLDANGVMTKGKSIYVNYSPTGNTPYDFVGSFITPDGSGGYILTGTISEDNDQCFTSSNVIRLSIVVRLDANLNVLWSRFIHHPGTTAYHRHVSANHALMSADNSTVYVTGQDRVVDGTGDKPVAYVAALNVNTGNQIWHKAYDMIYGGKPYYGVKLLWDNSGSLAWFLRPALVNGVGVQGIYALAQVSPGTGSVSNARIHQFEFGVPSDAEFLDDELLVVSSMAAADNQVLSGVDWPANNTIWNTIYLGPDANPNQSLCNAPYFEMSQSIALFYPQNLAVEYGQNTFVVNAGYVYAGKETITLNEFDVNGQFPVHLPDCLDPPGINDCESCAWAIKDFAMDVTGLDEEVEIAEAYPFNTQIVATGDAATILKDDCVNGVFAEVLNGISDSEITDTHEGIVYPNPVINNRFTMDMRGYSSNVVYNIYNLQGRVVKNGQFNTEKPIEIELDGLIPGSYLLQWNTVAGDSGYIKLVVD